MDTTESRAGRTGVLALSGAVDASSAPSLSERASALCDTDVQAVLIDLDQISHVTSAGFRSFIAIGKHAEQVGVTLALCGANDLVHDLFEVSGLAGSFRIYPDRASALAAIDQHGAS
jgi:anti-anti-sigma factor